MIAYPKSNSDQLIAYWNYVINEDASKQRYNKIPTINPSDIKTRADLIYYIKHRVHFGGACISPPMALHASSCPQINYSTDLICQCGVEELQREIEAIFR